MSDAPLTNDRVSSRVGRCFRGPYAHKITDAEYLERLLAKCKRDEYGCLIWQGTQIRSRLKLGWTLDQAEQMPITPKGHRPVNGSRKWVAKR